MSDVSPRRVSVVVSNYNYAHFLAESIDSVLDQHYPSLEIIVVDDASTDQSRQVLEAYGDRIQVVWQKKNEGQICAYNCGFELVTGDIVIFLDADDRFQKGSISQIVKAFEAGVSKVHWRAGLVDMVGSSMGVQVPAKLVAGDMAKLISQEGILYPSPPGSANAYLVDALRNIMPLPVNAAEKHGADFYTIYGVALLGRVAIAGQGRVLSDYRVHRVAADPGNSLSFGNAAQGYREGDRLELRSDVFRQWVSAWSHHQIQITRSLTEFSIEKNIFSHSIFGELTYWSGLRVGVACFGKFFRSIRYRPGPVPEKIALICIALAILILPRSMGLPVAKYLCDPSSR